MPWATATGTWGSAGGGLRRDDRHSPARLRVPGARSRGRAGHSCCVGRASRGPPLQLAHLRDGIGFPAAAALPVAGLTAALAFAKVTGLDGRRVLVTGSTGGVGLMLVQLGARAGAHVTAHVRSGLHRQLLGRLGASVVAVGADEAAANAPHDVIADLIGGALLGVALGWLASRVQQEEPT